LGGAQVVAVAFGRKVLCKRLVFAARTAKQAARVRPLPPGRGLALLGVLLVAVGCPGVGRGTGGSQGSDYPTARVYDFEPEFAGEWRGDVDGFQGILKIGELDDRSFFGSFVTHDGAVEYTLLLDHTYVDTEEGGEVPSNRAVFTWQDGLGSRGRGWLLINLEDTALTGSFGYGVATTGLGQWSFERVDG
jgi:hypothetical protein